MCLLVWDAIVSVFFFQAEDGIRDLVRSRGLGDVYKRQLIGRMPTPGRAEVVREELVTRVVGIGVGNGVSQSCLLYTSDAADERSSVDLGGRRIIKKKTRGTRGVGWVDK